MHASLKQPRHASARASKYVRAGAHLYVPYEAADSERGDIKSKGMETGKAQEKSSSGVVVVINLAGKK
jgi:hypothetical protein